ncbi:ABC transporter permease subunit [Actinoplanes sp. NPDC051411]|uniref:ABC transporter permease subunit n=1 Tax=Actinoplanes sp. NPDC051411 TaxID=3155522 RepID=UPI003427DFB3
MTATVTPYRSTVPAGRAGLTQLIRAEWTKFRTVRGWVIAATAGAVVMVALGLLIANGNDSTVQTSPDSPAVPGHPYIPTGPGGEAVNDSFYLVHQTLDGDGSITTRVSALTARRQARGTDGSIASVPADSLPTWAKAGLIIKANTGQGSVYAAIMVTAGHGVRMQYNYIHDIAGPTGTVSIASPRWLRLVRTGQTIDGYASLNGSSWTRVGTVRLPGLPRSVPAGMFAATPSQSAVLAQGLASSSVGSGAVVATATLDKPDLEGAWSTPGWTGTAIHSATDNTAGSGFQQTDTMYTVTGSGDIGPYVDTGGTPGQLLTGGFAALIVLTVLGVVFVTTEYRRGLIRTSLLLSPRRGRVLAAKAVVLGAVAFVTALLAAAITVPVGEHLEAAKGSFVEPISALTEARVIVGTAALLAVAAVLALAVGTMLRRGAAAVAVVIVLVALPNLLGIAGVLPTGASQWVLRLMPAAALAVQQTVPAYAQVDQTYSPMHGFYPLSPWVGFAVLCVWTALALAAAGYLLRRRDA